MGVWVRHGDKVNGVMHCFDSRLMQGHYKILRKILESSSLEGHTLATQCSHTLSLSRSKPSVKWPAALLDYFGHSSNTTCRGHHDVVFTI